MKKKRHFHFGEFLHFQFGTNKERLKYVQLFAKSGLKSGSLLRSIQR